jgi:uncharacterized protein YlaI
MGIHETARRIAFKHKPQRCEICNIEAKKLDVHHKDDNVRNNNIENLMVLCSSCHHKIDRRINNIFSNPNSVKNMAKTLRIKNALGLVERDELGRYKKGEYMEKPLEERRVE